MKLKFIPLFLKIFFMALAFMGMFLILYALFVIKVTPNGFSPIENYAQLGNSFGTLSTLFAGLSFMAIGIGFSLTFQGMKADHDRRRATATIKAVKELDNLLNNKHDVFGTNFKFKSNFKDSESLSQDKKKYLDSCLSEMEYFAIGINSKIYDRKLALLCFGPSLNNVFQWAKPYIAYRRSETGCEEYFLVAELLAKKFASDWEKGFKKKRRDPSQIINTQIQEV